MASKAPLMPDIGAIVKELRLLLRLITRELILFMKELILYGKATLLP